MSKAFTPPDSLSPQDIRTIADVRRDIWTHGLIGWGVGSVVAGLLHRILTVSHRRGYSWTRRLLSSTTASPLNRNTAMLAVLLGGATGSFLNATVTGKNQVHHLHPIFQMGARPPSTAVNQPNTSTGGNDNNAQVYFMRQQQLEQLQQEKEQLAKNRILRHASIQRTISSRGRGGISDSHGGTWYRDDNGDDDDQAPISSPKDPHGDAPVK